MRSVHPLTRYPADGNGGDGSDASSISFGMSYGTADPAVAYDDPTLWCHPSATPETVVVPSQLSTLANVQAHHIPLQHDHSYNYTAQEVYQNARSYHHQQPGSVHLTNCGTPNTYHTPQDFHIDGSPHIRTTATVCTPSETLLAPGRDVSSFSADSLSKASSQHYASPQLQYTGVAAGVQHFPGLHARSATMPYTSFPPPADPTSVYHDLTIPPPHFAEQISAPPVQLLERGHSFPGHRCADSPQSQHLDVPQIDGFQPTKSPHYRPSHHPHSPYASSRSISPSSSFISSPRASPGLPALSTHSEGTASRSASSRSSSAASSPFSTAPHLHATATPSPPSSSSSLSLPPPDTARFACRLCHGERTFSRTKDLERHIQSIHNRDPDAPRWVCCGVPLSEADRWALPEWVRREPPYMLNGVPMVGGCKEQCSRKDVLKRHLRKNESRCFGSENAPWLPGNQVCKRSPRGGGSAAVERTT